MNVSDLSTPPAVTWTLRADNFLATATSVYLPSIPTMSQEKASLVRIRENQRRSRARRKEYIQELEARLRHCELQGAEASAEIQAAARKVAEENKRLRELLAQRGFGEAKADSYIFTDDTTLSRRDAPVQVLEDLLATPKKCCPEGNTNTLTVTGMNCGIGKSGIRA